MSHRKAAPAETQSPSGQPCPFKMCPVTFIILYFPDPFKPFIIFSNRHEIRRIDLNKGEFSVLVPGLRNTIALDFHLSESALYWTDVVEDKIYRGKLSENGGEICVVSEFMTLIWWSPSNTLTQWWSYTAAKKNMGFKFLVAIATFSLSNMGSPQWFTGINCSVVLRQMLLLKQPSHFFNLNLRPAVTGFGDTGCGNEPTLSARNGILCCCCFFSFFIQKNITYKRQMTSVSLS